jgi:hypothetical protein
VERESASFKRRSTSCAVGYDAGSRRNAIHAPAAKGMAGTIISQRQSNMSVPSKSSSERTANATVTAMAKWNASAFHKRRRLARAMTSDSILVAHPQIGWDT